MEYKLAKKTIIIMKSNAYFREISCKWLYLINYANLNSFLKYKKKRPYKE